MGAVGVPTSRNPSSQYLEHERRHGASAAAWGEGVGSHSEGDDNSVASPAELGPPRRGGNALVSMAGPARRRRRAGVTAMCFILYDKGLMFE